MSFTLEQKSELAAKLDGAHVKKRKQGTAQVSYVEAWHVIAEANRIFGFDGWTRETLSTDCVYSGDYEKAVWENGRKSDKTVKSFRCTYNCRVRVTAGGVFRDGTGSGHGFGDNPGDAHESAVKEAETDAMKRALMTFGNPFGLALYDKEQAEVDHSGNGHAAAPPPVSDEERERAKEAAETIRTDIKTANTLDKLQSRLKAHGPSLARIKTVSPPAYDTLMQFAEMRRRTMAEAA